MIITTIPISPTDQIVLKHTNNVFYAEHVDETGVAKRITLNHKTLDSLTKDLIQLISLKKAGVNMSKPTRKELDTLLTYLVQVNVITKTERDDILLKAYPFLR